MAAYPATCGNRNALGRPHRGDAAGAGYAAKEVYLFADKMIEELDNYLAGRELDGRVTLEMLPTLA